MSVAKLCLLSLVACFALATISANNVQYQFPAKGAINQTVAQALSTMAPISVLNFGALGNGKEDDSAAFLSALGSDTDWPRMIWVPPGSYRLDATIYIESGKGLTLAQGATLIRKMVNGSCPNTGPVVALSGVGGQLSGSRSSSIQTECNEAPLGIVMIGPPSPTQYRNIEWNIVEGISIEGLSTQGNLSANTVGLHMHSSEPFVGGSCYQNTVRDLVFHNVNTGLQTMKYVNANTFSNLQLIGIGQYSVRFVNNSENQLSGMFTTGSRFISSVIRGEGSAFNWFSNIQSEPGGGQLFSFVAGSLQNTVIGHDNCPHGSQTTDPAFTWLSGGRLLLGNFSDTKMEYRNQLEVQGTATIQNLIHGFPRTAKTQGINITDTLLQEINEDEPLSLTQTPGQEANEHLQLCGFGLQHPKRKRQLGHYTLDLSVELGCAPRNGSCANLLVAETFRVTIASGHRPLVMQTASAGGAGATTKKRKDGSWCVLLEFPSVWLQVLLDVRRVGSPLNPLRHETHIGE